MRDAAANTISSTLWAACEEAAELEADLPGSPKAVQENLEYILPSLEHGVRIAAGLDGECARK